MNTVKTAGLRKPSSVLTAPLKFPPRNRVMFRAVLKQIVSGQLRHFCYPSGEFHPAQFPWLRAVGVESATTCLSGFNYPDTERLELRRFLDGENITQVEFEAEVSGFLELMRKLRWIVRHGQSG